MNIKKLINNNKWDKIYNLIIKKKINPEEIIANGNNIVHLAAINNNSKIINYFIDNNKQILNKSNDDGNTPIHLLAIYGYIDLLKQSIKKYPKFLDLLNNNNENIPNLLYNDAEFIEWVTKYKEFDILIDDINGQNIITKNITESSTIKDTNYKIIKNMINNNLDKIMNYNDSLLCYAIQENKPHIAKLLIKKGYDINKKDRGYSTPFLYAVKNKNYELIELLINKGANINYNGAEGDNNPLIFAINNNDDKMINLLVDNGFNINNYNRNLETPLHYALYNKNTKLKPTTISKLLYYGDLNIKNTSGETPLHLLCKNQNWRNYNSIIKNKKMDIFIEDNRNKRPFDYIDGNGVYDFINLIVTSYSNQIDGQITSIDQCRKNPDSEICKHELKKYIFKTKRSIPIAEDQMIMGNKMKLIIGKNALHGLFNSDSLHNMIYTVIMLMKYKNLGIPYQYYFNDKFINDKIKITTNNLYSQPHEMVISDLVKIYNDYFFEIVPYLIIWRDSNRYFVHDDIHYHINKCLVSKNIRFILFKLTLVITPNSTHANIILYDKVKNTLERFEPYGVIPYLETNKLDEFIEQMGRKLINKDLTYYSPKDIFGTIGFQTISNDSRHEVKKLADPAGFCLSWTFWYLEMRLNNPEIHPSEIIKQSKDKIINTSIADGDKMFITFIRNYASDLDKQKNQFMASAGIHINEMYNLLLTPNDQRKITMYMTSIFGKIIEERY
ncbi:ankyrin repeat protein [Fadolivirus algeromassiliense]|jgi:ankyrin repeat protein|uniref:Ankyrin repeat protein n=1 Tax=Fadolivirus FV1/VV64 TaxID=3070911 RepID=A0A7D3UV22_9VIRU|nr:ankyrin repeat protein [Fadolivirus algeromassiliense]QKF93829.1 ankyrin repeat protein [Fadolivirus FV1/VV64]